MQPSCQELRCEVGHGYVRAFARGCIVNDMLQNDSFGGLIASFSAVGRDDVSLAGGKGANLGELTRAGVRVPPGLVVTCDAYFRFLHEAGLRPEIERLLGGLDCNDRARLEGVAMEAKHMVTSAPVQAERSGVMFTVNPVTNDSSSVVIEAVFGLGEAVVSGLVTPDMYIVDKGSGVVLDRQVVAQEQELVRRPNATRDEEQCHWVPVAFERRFRPKLSDEEVGELAAIGRQIEQHFGCPQDIEWALHEGMLWIVQARPVTSRGS